MPQGPLEVATGLTTGKTGSLNSLDKTGNLLIGKGVTTTLNITTSTVVSLVPVRVGKAVLQTAGSTNSILYDAATVATASATNQIASLATSQITPLDVDWPCLTGLVVVPGTSAVVAVSTK